MPCISTNTPPSALRLTHYIILALLLGITTGTLAGGLAAPLGIIGLLYIQLIKVLAVPLVFISILEATTSTPLSWSTARRWLTVITINTSCALLIGLTIANTIKPGSYSDLGFLLSSTSLTPHKQTLKQLSFVDFLNSLVPKSIISPFAENNVIAVALIALLIGLALRRYTESKESELSPQLAGRGLRVLSAILNQLITKLVVIVPFAVFCVTAKTVGESGLQPFSGLILYLLTACLGLLLQLLIVYPIWIIAVAGIPIIRFLKVAARPAAYAFGTNSSLATVPLTLSALDELGVPRAASRLATCIGTNLNNDGIILYEALAVLFVAQALGIELSLGEQLYAAFMSVIAAVGVAGVPEAGVVSLSLVLSAVGLPIELVPLLLAVDWFIARLRSVVNVISDMTVSVAVGGRG
jgi:DAACS family dicarboxylate/amino acid:cation (Na+ or H+) symporter